MCWADDLVILIDAHLRHDWLLGGSGYRPDPGSGLGHDRGPLAVGGLVFDLRDPKQFAEVQGLNEMLCRWELSTGEVSHGMHEKACFDAYRP